ncbi:MAG: hypothetical protein RI554_09410, partial [Trueperaceae bacterium]|nr:hypothetical protein [Trueperaceae bacterium]
DALAEAGTALADPDVRLVGVRGAPGAGASRLVRDALAATAPAGVGGRPPDVVSLAGVADADAAWARVADALVPDAPSRDASDVLEALARAADAPALWWFDDVHGALAPALAPGLATLLARAPRLRVVVAGHDVVGWAGERTVHVPPLSPEEGAALLRTFLPGAVSPADADLAALAAWTEGHALALVLTGARLRAAGGRGFDPGGAPPTAVLRDGPYGLADRHRSLASTVATGLQGLRESQRALLEAVAWTRAPASREAVAALLDRDATLTGRRLEDAVRRGTVRVVPGPRGEPRYAPEPAYAWAASTSRRTPPEAPTALAARHARWFLGRARDAADRAQAPYRARLLADVGWAMDDVDAALDGLADRDALEALRNAVALAPLHRRFGRAASALERLGRLEATAGGRLDAAARADAAHARGTLAFLASRPAEARTALEAARTAREALGDAHALAETRMALAILDAQRGAFDEAVRGLEATAALVKDEATTWAGAARAMNLANVHAAAGDDAASVGAFADATRRFHALGDLEGATGAALGWLGAAATLGDPNAVRQAYQRLLPIVTAMDEGADVRLANAFHGAILRLRDAGMEAYARDLRALAAHAATAFGWANDPHAGPAVAALAAALPDGSAPDGSAPDGPAPGGPAPGVTDGSEP